MKKALKVTLYTVTIIYALVGFFLTSMFFAIKLHLTDDPGAVDVNDRYFSEMSNKQHKITTADSAKSMASWYVKIKILEQFYPKNANLILNSLNQSKNPQVAAKMFEAVDLYLQKDQQYVAQIQKAGSVLDQTSSAASDSNIFDWMNMDEWKIFKEAVIKDSALIHRAAIETDIEPRLIVSCLVGEQIRLFNSEREAYKKWIGPLKILSNETKISLGVTGIKEETAINIEKHLKNKNSIFYIGEKYEKLLDFKSNDTDSERYKRLTTYHNHYYSYIYAAVFLKQVIKQWKDAGYDVSHRPEILATLFNVGYIQSQPKPDPKVGGSRVTIKGKSYTFGTIAYQFYYSGELAEKFPITLKYL